MIRATKVQVCLEAVIKSEKIKLINIPTPLRKLKLTNVYTLTFYVKEHVLATPTTTNSTYLLMTLAKFAKVHTQLTRDIKSHLVLSVFKGTDAQYL